MYPRQRPCSRVATRAGRKEIGLTACRDVTGNGDFGRAATSTASDVDLGAGDVPLGGTGDVETDLLDTEEVLRIQVSYVNRDSKVK